MHVDRQVYRKMRKQYGSETVFVLSSASLFHIKDGYIKDSAHDLLQYDKLGQYILRCDAEQNYALQQIVTFAIIRNTNKKYLVSERLKGDERIEGKYMLGFGGHVEQRDGHRNVIVNCLHRELSEELFYESMTTPVLLGTIRDMSAPAREHIGFVFELTAKRCKIKEVDKLIGHWFSKEELFERYYSFDSWSKKIIDSLYRESL